MAGRLTDVQAVNQMLAAVGIRQVSTAASETGSDDASDALRCLYRTNTEVQARGWPANTLRGIGIAASGGSNQITFTGTNYNGSAIVPLRVECVAPGKWRGNVELAGDKAYIVTENTDNFGSAVTVYFDIIHELDFAAECPVDLQSVIVAEAIANFKAERAGLMYERSQAREAKAEVTANRFRGEGRVDINDRPIVMSGSPAQ